tara:strand:- start:331 stop:474 length:144 start_codon:yes stop_codon:yes gene_type:complete
MPSYNDLDIENNTISTMDNTPLLPKLKKIGGLGGSEKVIIGKSKKLI